MVDLYARAGLLDEAYKLMCDMNIKPNSAVWGAILGACSIHGNSLLGEVGSMHLCDMDPKNSVNYVVLGKPICCIWCMGQCFGNSKFDRE
ncbi:hypothetical protein ACFX2J_004291 [Malus domestica]